MGWKAMVKRKGTSTASLQAPRANEGFLMFSLDATDRATARPVDITKVGEHADQAGYPSTMAVRRLPRFLLIVIVFATGGSVLTLTRLGQGEASTTRFTAPVFEPAG
jgi:hypothetical protein